MSEKEKSFLYTVLELENLKDEIKQLQEAKKHLEKVVRKIALEDLKIKKLKNDLIEVEVREKKSFDIGIVRYDYPELYKEYTDIFPKTVTTEERVFDKKNFMKNHAEIYDKCFVKGTPGIYIKRR